jgi:hypothetical protein
MNNYQAMFNWRSKKAPPQIASFNLTQSGIRYEFDLTISAQFLKWSMQYRQKGLKPLFSDFYNELSNEDRNRVTLTYNKQS